MWVKVRQLTDRSKTASNIGNNAAIRADALNEHYAAISTASYTAPSIKSTAKQLASGESHHRLENVRDARYSVINNNGTGLYPGLVLACRRSVLRRSDCRHDESVAIFVRRAASMEGGLNPSNIQDIGSSISI